MMSARIVLGLFLLSGSSLFGTVIVSEDFESASGLFDGNWAANASGVVLIDPLNSSNHVLGFTSLDFGGDLFSVQIASSAAPNYFLSFDYYVPSQPGGGFVGVYDTGGVQWLAGNCNGCYPSQTSLDGLPAGQWNHVNIEFANRFPSSGTIYLALEQYTVGTPPSALFDNIVISDSGFASIPEPSSALLMLGGLAALAAARKARRT